VNSCLKRDFFKLHQSQGGGIWVNRQARRALIFRSYCAQPKGSRSGVPCCSARNEAVAAFAALPAGQKVRASDVKTKEVVVTDKNTRETKKYQAFESVSLDIPLSAKGTPEHDAAMDKLKTLAQRVADERGSSEIVVALTPVDARARKVAATSGTVQTSKGNTITVSKVADDSVPKGVERITVKAGRLQTEV
jgi:hypothetical protein